MRPLNGAPPARGLPQAPEASPMHPMSGVSPMGFLPRGMPLPRPMGAPAMPSGSDGQLRGPPMTLGPRGIVLRPGGESVEAATQSATPGGTSVQDPGPVTVFVGKLPPNLHDNYIRRLLGTCGTVTTWTRMNDPVTNKPKGFGYCTYERTLEVTRALRLLDGFAIGSQPILLKADSKKQEKLDAYERSLPDDVRASERATDESVKQTLRSIFQRQSGDNGGHQNGEASVDNSIGGNEPSRPVGGQDEEPVALAKPTAAAVGGSGPDIEATNSKGADGSNAANTGAHSQMVMSEVEKFRLAQKDRDEELEKRRHEAVRKRLRLEREQEELRKAAKEITEEMSQEPVDVGENISAEDQTREKQTGRKQGDAAVMVQKPDVAETARDPHGGLPSRERGTRGGGSRHCRGRSRSRSRSLDKHDRRSSRRRPRHQHGSHNGEKSASRSRSRSRSHRHSSRRRSRRRSRSHSGGRSERRRRRESSDVDTSTARDGSRRQEAEQKHHQTVSTTDEKLSGKRRSRSPQTNEGDGSSERGSSKLPRVEEDRKPSEAKVSPNLSTKKMPKVVLGLKLQSNTAKKDKPTPVMSVPQAFGIQEDVEVKPTREIVPIDYTDEDRGPLIPEQTAPSRTVDANKLKALIEQIPTDKEALFAFPIDWAVVDAQRLVESKMRAWVGKKILEYLGEEEPAMTDFVLGKLREHAGPQVILDELRLVLESEADMFVTLLWRKLAFEAARAHQL